MHDRSRGRARRSGGTWVSRCRRCHVPMQRLPGGKWVVVKLDEPDLAEDETIVVVEDQALAAESIMPEEAAPEPTLEPEDSPAPSAFRRTMRYLWYGRG